MILPKTWGNIYRFVRNFSKIIETHPLREIPTWCIYCKNTGRIKCRMHIFDKNNNCVQCGNSGMIPCPFC